ncbi:MAG: hypothetical protein HRU34_10465 [Richelia sp.]|nr:hypothetical protein [Richelia sp.]
MVKKMNFLFKLLVVAIIFFNGVAESGDHFTKCSTISQWFQTLIHPALMQRLFNLTGCAEKVVS